MMSCNGIEKNQRVYWKRIFIDGIMMNVILVKYINLGVGMKI